VTPIYYAGLDLGQKQDYSALCVLERPADESVPTHHLRHLQRWPLGTPYTQIATDAVALLGRPPLPGCTLLADQTGVGAAVMDLLREKLSGSATCTLWPVTITGGSGFTMNRQVGLHVAKYELVAAMAVVFETRRLKVARELPEAPALMKELENFKVKLTKAGNETFECLVAGTTVETEAGPRPIEMVRAGDRVLTRGGYRNVRWAGKTKEVKELVSVGLSSGETLTGTPDHLTWTETRGWVPLVLLRDHDELQTWEASWLRTNGTRTPKPSRPMASFTAGRRATPTTTTAEGGRSTVCIAPSGSFTTARSRTNTTFTTPMRIRITTTFRISNASQKSSTLESIIPAPRGRSNAQCAARGSCAVACVARDIGIGAITIVPVDVPDNASRLSNVLASNVGRNSSEVVPMCGPVLPPVGRLTATCTESSPSGSVSNARPTLWRNTRSPGSVRVVAAPVIALSSEPVPVYDLIVDDDHEFFANGVLVHNSWRDSMHDDLVLAAAMPVFAAENDARNARKAAAKAAAEAEARRRQEGDDRYRGWRPVG
jgi:hypothetical protein